MFSRLTRPTATLAQFLRVPSVSHVRFSTSSSSVSLSMTPQSFRAFLQSNNINRAYFVWDAQAKKLISSHPELEPIAAAIQANKRDFHEHEGIFLEISPITKSLFSAAVANTTRGQGSGGTRYWEYGTIGEFVSDGLRLSRGMGHKNALAGLWWGGGKGQILREKERTPWQEREFRDTLFREYGTFISSLRGCYITAEDAGVYTVDMGHLGSRTRHVTCIPEEVGGSGNPSIKTGWGVASGMEAAVNWVARAEGKPETGLVGKRVAVQGLGNVALPMIAKIFEKGVGSVIASDISQAAVDKAREIFRGKSFEAVLTRPGDNSILAAPGVDVVSPCALGGILNAETIPKLSSSVRVVCGAANNQLLDDQQDDKRITERGIMYSPDFLVNRMGIVNCSNECFGTMPSDPAIFRHFDASWEHSIPRAIQKTFDLAKNEKITTARAAIKLAEQNMREPHPIFPNRSRQIIQSLVEDEWHKQSGPITKPKKEVKV